MKDKKPKYLFVLVFLTCFLSGCYCMSDQAYWKGIEKAQSRYIKDHPDLDSRTKELISQNKIAIGMKKDHVRLNGNYRYPQKIRESNKYGTDEVWIYYRRYNREVEPHKIGGFLGLGSSESTVKGFLVYEKLYFKDDILLKIEEEETNKEW